MAEEMKITNLRLNVSFLNDSALLSDEELGRLVRYGLHYVKGDADYAMLKGNEYFLAPTIERYASEDNERYVQTCKNNRRNIQKRWDKSKDTTVYDRIQTYTNDTNTKTKSNTNTNIKRERNFVPPTLDEVKAYCNEKGYKVNPERFVAFYASKGWKVGNQSMKDWRAAVVSWEQRRKEEAVPTNQDSTNDVGDVFSKALSKMKEHRE
jgi:hypothetical protein